MNFDEGMLAQVASSHNIPPAILNAIAMHDPGGGMRLSPATLGSYGIAPAELAHNESLQLEIAARTLESSFHQYGNWEEALSEYVAGDPKAYMSPTSSVGGFVYAVLGGAATNPGYGMAGFNPSNPYAFGSMAGSLANHMDEIGKSGGVVNPFAGGVYRKQIAQVQSSAFAYQGSFGSSPAGNLNPKGGYPAMMFSAHPFASQFMGSESENFGMRTGFGTEIGNDFGMPVGQALTAAESGTIEVRPFAGKLNVFLKVSSGPWAGWEIGYGHTSSLNVKTGDTVVAGQVLGKSGGDPSDPNAGSSSGPHLEFQLRDPQGNWRDPQAVLQKTLGAQGSMTSSNYGGAGKPSAAAEKGAGDVGKKLKPPDPTLNPSEVGQFAQQMKGMGADLGHFQQHWSFVNSLFQRLLQRKPTLDDYRAMQAMNPQDMTNYVRSLPHSTYPEVQAGALSDRYSAAALHSIPIAGRTPNMGEVARLHAAGAGWKETQDFYKSMQPASEGVGQGAQGAAAPQQPQPEQRQPRRGSF